MLNLLISYSTFQLQTKLGNIWMNFVFNLTNLISFNYRYNLKKDSAQQLQD